MKDYFIIFLAMLCLGLAYSAHENSTNLIVMRMQKNMYQEELNRFSAFNRAMQEIGKIPYDANFANCYDQSKLLTQKFTDANIKSSIIINEDRSHSWVAVWIEATSGQFVPVSEEGVLEIRDGADPIQVQCYNTRI